MSSTKYVPPQMRNNAKKEEPRYNHRRNYKPQWEIEQEEAELKKKKQEEELAKKQELNEDNFPNLRGPVSKVTVWGEKKSFASLAAEWNEKSKNDEIEKRVQEKESYEHYRRSNAPLPKFYNIHRFVEPEDDEAPNQQERRTEESEWTLVDHRKYRREKTIEEKVNRPPTPEDNSVWDNDEDETCWDTK